jgi:hypothetical protein
MSIVLICLDSPDRAGSTEAIITKKRKGNSNIADMDRKYRQRCTDINKVRHRRCSLVSGYV